MFSSDPEFLLTGGVYMSLLSFISIYARIRYMICVQPTCGREARLVYRMSLDHLQLGF